MHPGAFGSFTPAVYRAACRLLTLEASLRRCTPSTTAAVARAAKRRTDGDEPGALTLPLFDASVPVAALPSAALLEQQERERQMRLLVSVLPDGAVARSVQFPEDEWSQLSHARRSEVLTRQAHQFGVLHQLVDQRIWIGVKLRRR